MNRYQPNRVPSRDRNYLMILLVLLVFILLIIPLLSDSTTSSTFLRLGVTVLMLVAANATERPKLVLFAGLAAAGLVIPLDWYFFIFKEMWVERIVWILESAFFFVMAALILVAVVRKHLATANAIYGAISAYLLIGFAWTLLYVGAARMDGDSWAIDGLPMQSEGVGEIQLLSHFVYFSFVTMSTLGYGDLVPQTPFVQTLSWMQSVTGQFYMAVMVAWLVSEMPRRQEQRGPKEDSA